VTREKNADDADNLDTTNGEKDAAQEALNRLDTDTAPTLTHPSGVGHPSRSCPRRKSLGNAQRPPTSYDRASCRSALPGIEPLSRSVGPGRGRLVGDR